MKRHRDDARDGVNAMHKSNADQMFVGRDMFEGLGLTEDERIARGQELRRKNRQLMFENAEHLDMYYADRKCEKCGFEVMGTVLLEACYTRRGWEERGTSNASNLLPHVPLMHRRCGRCKNECWERPLDWSCTT